MYILINTLQIYRDFQATSCTSIRIFTYKRNGEIREKIPDSEGFEFENYSAAFPPDGKCGEEGRGTAGVAGVEG